MIAGIHVGIKSQNSNKFCIEIWRAEKGEKEDEVGTDKILKNEEMKNLTYLKHVQF
jgi:hypothetical protein